MKNEYFFKIIIPNYNNGEWIGKCLNSIFNQTFKDYVVVVIDDVSTDNSVEVVQEYSNKDMNIHLIQALDKVYNGGARNIGIKDVSINSTYTLFIDSDDWYKDDNVLEKIHKVIIDNNFPDCVSLSYDCLIGDTCHRQVLVRNSREEMVSSLYVACWTKCIKSDLVVEFPENTLMEDVVQHIKQCDNIESIVSIEDSCIVWNRNNTNSCSRVENQDLQRGKWQSSMYRYCADLMDLECKNKCCEEHRQWRLSVVVDNIKNGVYLQ